MPRRSKILWRLRHNTARPNIVRADQPQPVDPLGVGQFSRRRDVAVVHVMSPGGSVEQPEGVGNGVQTSHFIYPSVAPAPRAQSRARRGRRKCFPIFGNKVDFRGKSPALCTHPVPQEGTLATSLTLGQAAVDVLVSQDVRR